MPLTVQKLRARLAEMALAAEDVPIFLSPVFVTSASGPMAPPPLSGDRLWAPVEAGQLWGVTHGTNWLATTLQVPEEMVEPPVVLQLHWDVPPEDSLLRRLEATVFLDGRAIGGFDWAHRTLLLPSFACDGRVHELTIQVYTLTPMPFDGLTMQLRHEAVWKLYHTMQTVLEVCEALQERDIAHYVLLERLNAAYTMLDLREGWQSERFRCSAAQALEYLQTHLNDELVGGGRPHVLVNGHAHLDVAWQWPYWRSRQKIAHTISNVLALMDRYPFYHYGQSQPQLLQWLKEDAPEMYARVKERVAEGRFEPVGAMWVEADCNLTSGESLVRQILHGTRFTEQEFGITPKVIWLPDVFGYSAALPQIMRGCDIPVFMTTKISWNQFNRMPCDTFRWRGIDGTEVLTHFITAPDLHTTTTYYTYNGPLRAEDMTGTWANYRQQEINDQLLYLAGWGDGGGGATEEQLERLQLMADLPNFPRVRAGRAGDYFTELYQRVWDDPHLPRWVGELYLEYHRGTYTSQARTKQHNRRAELYYRETELLNAWASLYGMPSRQEQLNQGWRLILLNQFHDVLPGSSIHEVYEDTERIYAEIQALARQVHDEALTILAQHITAYEQDLVLLNTLTWSRNDPVQIPAHLVPQPAEAQPATDWDGNHLWLLDGVEVPATGVTVLTTDR